MTHRDLSLSTGEALLVTCVVGWVFHLLSWILQSPPVWNTVGKYLSRFESFPKKDLDAILSGIHIRAVGAIHNTIQVALSLYALRNPELWTDTWHGVTPLTQWILAISAGFFLWDVAVSIRRAAIDGPEFILHGLLCFLFYLYVTISKNFHFYGPICQHKQRKYRMCVRACGYVCAGCGFLLWEMSTPFVHLRWLLYKSGLKNSKLYLYNGMSMMVMFAMCRILWGGYLGMRFLLSSRYPQDAIASEIIWCLRGIWITLNFLNWYWFKQMLAAAWRLFFKRPQKTIEPLPDSNGLTNPTAESKKVK